MKKRLLVLSLFLLCAMTATAFAGAPDRVNRLDWGVYGAGAFNDKADDTGFIATSFSYGLSPYIALGVEGGYQGADAAAADQTFGLAEVLADIIVRAPQLHDQLVPYAIVGLGVTGVWIEDDNGTGANNGHDEADSAFGWKVGGGIDWFFNDNWIGNFEFDYHDSSVGLGEHSNSSIGNNVSFWTIGGGLKYAF